MSFVSFYPPSGGGSSSNPSVGINGAAAPGSSTQVSGIGPDGNAHPISTDNAGVQNVNVIASVAPAGSATAANQATGNASLASIDSKLTAPLAVTGPLTDTQLRATAVPISGTVTVVQPTGTNLHVVVDSAPLATGAATAANQATQITSLQSIDSKLTSPLAVSGTFFQATQPVSAASLPLPAGASTSALQTSGNASLTSIDSKLTSPLAVTGTFFQATQPVSAATLPLPTGAATETTLAAINTKTPALGQAVMAASVPVVFASNQTPLSVTTAASTVTRANAPSRNVYSTTPVSVGTYTQLVASTTTTTTAIEIFDSSGQTLALATGAAASEVVQLYITPGGNGRIAFTIPSGTRVSITAVSAAANVGEIVINYYA